MNKLIIMELEFWSEAWTEFVEQHPILIGIRGVLSLIGLIAGVIWIVKTQRYRYPGH